MVGGLPLLAKASVDSNRRHAVTPDPSGTFLVSVIGILPPCPEKYLKIRRAAFFGAAAQSRNCPLSDRQEAVQVGTAGIPIHLPLFWWQAQHPPQLAQLPPQEDFPCFLSRIMMRTIRITTARRTRPTTIVPIFSQIHCSIKITPLRKNRLWSRAECPAPEC